MDLAILSSMNEYLIRVGHRREITANPVGSRAGSNEIHAGLYDTLWTIIEERVSCWYGNGETVAQRTQSTRVQLEIVTGTARIASAISCMSAEKKASIYYRI